MSDQAVPEVFTRMEHFLGLATGSVRPERTLRWCGLDAFDLVEIANHFGSSVILDESDLALSWAEVFRKLRVKYDGQPRRRDRRPPGR